MADYYTLQNVPVSVEYVTSEMLNDYMSFERGGMVSSNFGAHKSDFQILSGDFIQRSSSNVLNYSAKNSFIQAEEVKSSSGKSYGPAYTGSKGYCILSVIPSTNELMLSGNISAITNLFDDSKTTLDEKYPHLFPANSASVKMFHGVNSFTISNIKNLQYSFALNNKSKTHAFSIVSAVQHLGIEGDVILSDGYGMISVDEIDYEISTAMSEDATMQNYIDLFSHDDNALYCVGFPEIGNVVIENFYAQHAEGGSVRAIGKYSHAEGRDTIADERYSHAEGSHNIAGELASHAEGFYTIAQGLYSHAEGSQTRAFNMASHSEGHYTQSGDGAKVTDRRSDIDPNSREAGKGSHSEGIGTGAAGVAAHAEGFMTLANGDTSHASGIWARAMNDNAWVWNGDTSVTYAYPYESTKDGSFNVNPKDGINGFFVGSETLSAIIIRVLQDHGLI